MLPGMYGTGTVTENRVIPPVEQLHPGGFLTAPALLGFGLPARRRAG